MVSHSDKAIIYVVDDDAAVRNMLHQLITYTASMAVRTFASAEDFIAAYRPGPCECLVSDIRMPGTGGLELQQRLKELGATLPIIFMSGHGAIGVAVEAMRQGAFDYLEKPFACTDLLVKIHGALAKSRQLFAQRLEQEAAENRLRQLTGKEREIVGLVVAGKSSREISAELEISVRTVENHRARIMEKLDVHSTVALIRLLS